MYFKTIVHIAEIFCSLRAVNERKRLSVFTVIQKCGEPVEISN